jgi:hypothetical protein
MSLLHVHNGDCSANILRRSGLPGEQLVWREALIAGPTPQGLSSEAWRAMRANYLAEAYGREAAECMAGLAEQEEALRRFSEYEEVTLWFEHDLFCQTLLIYLLDWFSQVELNETKLSLVCINQFPAISDFRGLGQLSPEQMASLFETRREVTDAELDLAVRSWAAYCSPNPQALEELLAGDTSALPFLRDAFLHHLARFPSTGNGLGRIENKALELINAGYSEFASLFNEFGHAEPVYGLGDFQFWNDLKRIGAASQPLLLIDGLKMVSPDEAQDFTKSVFKLTEAGHTIRSAKDDFLKMNAVDFWLGGVHLSAQGQIWRWHEQRQQLVYTSG